MTYEIERLQNLDINDADLIFFPVLRHGHYFLICINVKASKLEIIDNKSLIRGVTMKDKYGDCTTLLVDELTEEVVDMSWKESENYIDCGLFVMRHMETYKGTLKKWNPGFRKKASLNEDFLIGLRARFRRFQGPPAVDTARAVSDRAGDLREKAERSPLRLLPSSPRAAVCRCRVNKIAAAPAIVRLTDARSRQRHTPSSPIVSIV
nr:uncharacterized protein LOC109158392 [Ipomoea batatas]